MMSKQDKIAEDISEIKITLARNTDSLQEHMRRTDQNEEAIAVIREESMEVKAHIQSVKLLFRIIAGLGAITAFIVASINLIKLLHR